MKRTPQALLIAIALVACRRDPTATEQSLAMDFGAGLTAARGMSAPAMAKAPVAPAPVNDQKVIRNANLRIEVKSVEAAARFADSVATAALGITSSSQTDRGDLGETEALVTLRIPSARFDATLAAMRGLGRVRFQNVVAEDVTRAYQDLAIRIVVKRDLVTRLRALAGRTAKLADLLQVERELSRAVTELEQMEGEQRSYDAQISLSTIAVTFFEPIAVAPRRMTDPIVVALRESAVLFGQSVAGLVAMLAYAAPWVVVALVAWRLGRPLFRRRAVET